MCRYMLHLVALRDTDLSPSSGVLPSRQMLLIEFYIRGRCPRLLMVVPSRHRSACGEVVGTEDRPDI